MVKKTTKSTKLPQPLPTKLQQGLENADMLLKQERWIEAQELLIDLDQRFPDQPEVLAPLAHVCIEQQNWAEFLYASERLSKFDPDDPDLQLSLAGAYLSSGFSASALLTMRSFLQRWPNHEEIEEAKQTVDNLEEELYRLYTMENTLPEVGEKTLKGFAEWIRNVKEVESVELLASQKRYRQAIYHGEAALKRIPAFIPLLNMLSVVYWMNGQTEKAINCAQQALALQPDNILALLNLARFDLLSGRVNNAIEILQDIKTRHCTNYPYVAKVIELLTYLGDHEGVIQAYECLSKLAALDGSVPSEGFLYHLVATALAHQGDQIKARKLWQKALEINPDFDVVQENLKDLDKPIAERNGPYAYDLKQWLSPKAISDMEREWYSIKDEDNAGWNRAMYRWIKRHPEINNLAQYILRLGSESGRGFIISLVEKSDSAQLLEVVRDFALGQSGSDELRLAAANRLAFAGHLHTGMHPLWLNGQWTDTLLMGVNLVPANIQKHGAKVEKWLRAALNSAKEGHYKQAGNLLHQALEHEPDAPDLLFNLAAACQNQGRFDESEALLNQVVEQSPHNIMAAASLAQLYISRQQLDRGRELLKPLRLMKQMTYYEFDAFCAAHIDLYLTENDRKTAQAWFGIWESADPKNPKLERYKSLF